MMSSKALNKLLLLSKLGQAKCLNCGESWGSHAGIYCLGGVDRNKTFRPSGFSLSDRCANCGNMLVDHYKRGMCRNEETVFEKMFDEIFKEEEFLL